MAQQWRTQRDLHRFVIVLDPPADWEGCCRAIDFPPLDGSRADDEGVPCGGFVHDWRALPFLDWQLRAASADRAAAAPPPSREAFDAALRDAFRHWHDDDALAGNALAAAAWLAAAGHLGEALAASPRDRKFFRVLDCTFFRPAGTQEAAAERLGVPFGTYRYRLAVAVAVERVGERLWRRSRGG